MKKFYIWQDSQDGNTYHVGVKYKPDGEMYVLSTWFHDCLADVEPDLLNAGREPTEIKISIEFAK